VKALADRLPFHYAWLIVIAGIFANGAATGGTFWVMAIYVPAVSDDFGQPRFGIVLAFMVGQTLAAFAGPFAGRLIDLYGARLALLASSVLLPYALFLTSFSTELWQLFLGWGLASIARAWIFPISYNWLITRWFEGRRQAALGVVTVGFGVGGVALWPLAAIEERWDWRAVMLTTAAAIFIVHGLAAWLIVRNRPEELGLRPQGAADDEAPLRDEGGFTASQAVRTMTFWLLAPGLMFFFSGQGAVTTLAIDFFESRAVAGAATIVALTALVRTIARLPFGLALSRIDRVFALAMVVTLSQAIALLVLVTVDTRLGIVAYVLLWGIGGAFAPMLEPLLVTRAFGVRNFGAVSGVVAMIAFGGQLFGPVGGAALFDRTGSYTLAYVLFAVGFIVAMVLFAATSLRLRSRSHREAAERAGMSRER
jgi:MFS family permease